jgi:S-formylglutathione hydrolase FrmB
MEMEKMKLNESEVKDKEFKALPEEYRSENEKQGVIQSLEYNVPNLENGADIKHLNVYLPYCYDAADTNRKYNVLYLMHGGGENENLLFGGPGENRELKNILDNMIAKGDIEPIIVVTPTFYGLKNRLKYKGENFDVKTVDHPIPVIETKYFHDELINDLIPFVETKYNTYAVSGSKEDLKASRDHRAFGGFSMGSVTTWYTYINCLDYFKYFMPLSGDCWALTQKAEGSMAKETAELLAKAAKDAGYTPKDYYLFCATGNLDIAYPNMKPQMDAMKELSDSFVYSADPKEGNFYFIDCDGGVHNWNWVNQYIYDILPDLFKN